MMASNSRTLRWPNFMRTWVWTPDMGMLAILYSSYAVYTMNRKSVSLSLPVLLADGMSTSTAGMIVSSQNTAYAFSKLAGGFASDYFNPRRLLGLSLVCCGLTTLLFSCMDADRGFIFAWFMNGISHGPGWPACAKMLQMGSPAHFGTMYSILSTSVNFSGVLSPLLAAILIPIFGWRWNLLLISGLTILMGLFCLVALKERLPTERMNKDKTNTTTLKEKTSLQSTPKVTLETSTLKQLLQNPLLWLVSFCYLIVFCAKTALTDWSQVILVNEYGLSLIIGSKFASSLEFGGFIGSLLVGYLTDRYVQKMEGKTEAIHVRMQCALICTFGVCLSLHFFCFFIDAQSSQMMILLLAFLLGAFIYGQIVMYGLVATIMVPTHLSGTSHSIVALCANFGAIIAGFPLANIAGRFDWRTAFALVEGASALAVIVLFACINVTKRKDKTA